MKILSVNKKPVVELLVTHSFMTSRTIKTTFFSINIKDKNLISDNFQKSFGKF